MTNFPNGVSSFGVPILGSGSNIIPPIAGGKVFFVHYGTGNNGSGRGTSPTEPLKTLAYAISLTRASKGDVIVLMPGHAEDITAAGTVTVDKAGISIIGVGNGSLRPTFTWTTVDTATFLISANDVLVRNCVFDGTGVDAVATMFSISGDDVAIESSRFLMADSGGQAVLAITLATGADRTRIQGNEFIAPNAGATAAIYSVAAVSGTIIADNHFEGDFATAAINNITAAMLLTRVLRNTYYGTNASEPMLELLTGATGIAAYNVSGCATFSAGGGYIADGMFKFENYLTDTATGSGILDPTGVTL